MKVNYQHVIQETPSELKKLQTQQKELSKFRKMQGLYLLKTGEVKTVTHLADYLGVHRVTIQKWLKSYRQQGVSGLLSEPEDQGGRPKQLEDSAIAHLQQRLSQKEKGFRSYGEIQKWLEDNYQILLNYKTLYHLVRYKLKAKLKVPRRSAAKKNEEEAEAFKKKLPLLLKTVEWLEKMEGKENRKIRYWCDSFPGIEFRGLRVTAQPRSRRNTTRVKDN
jgi:putative transposase